LPRALQSFSNMKWPTFIIFIVSTLSNSACRPQCLLLHQ
jgi:hypothetical protein